MERMLGLTPSSFYFLYNSRKVAVKKKLKTLKTRILPAQMVAGLAASIQRVTPTDSVKFQSFAHWMIDEFICCHTGDTRQDVIDIALGQNPDFSVRHSVQILLSSGDVRAEAFVR